MINNTLKGYFYSAGSAARFSAVLQVEQHRFRICLASDQTVCYEGLCADLTVSERLGTLDRTLTGKEGSVFVTADQEGVDRLFLSASPLSNALHRLESSMPSVLIALAITILSVIALFKWGIPWVSLHLAHALPHQANELISDHTLALLDDMIFEETQLDIEQQNKIKAHFASQLVPLETQSDSTWTLHFRRLGEGMANAFALPSGDIILTDALVELSENQQELDSVLLHEMAHVTHRHGLQMVIRGALFSTIVILATGDANAWVDASMGMGTMLLNSHYSRDHEAQADDYAFKKMRVLGIDPIHFANMMIKIEPSLVPSLDNTSDHSHSNSTQANEASVSFDFLATHPSTQARIQKAKRYSQCFQQGLSICAP